MEPRGDRKFRRSCVDFGLAALVEEDHAEDDGELVPGNRLTCHVPRFDRGAPGGLIHDGGRIDRRRSPAPADVVVDVESDRPVLVAEKPRPPCACRRSPWCPFSATGSATT